MLEAAVYARARLAEGVPLPLVEANAEALGEGEEI
jgi:hypothetical protein